MAYKIHIKVISVRLLLTLSLVTLVMTYQFSGLHTAAMLDYECLICCWVNARMLDETIIVENLAFKSSLYLEKSKSYGEFAIYLINIWRPCWFSIFGGRWEYFTILFEILTDENVGIDTKTKSLDSLVRQMLLRGFT